MPYFNAADTDTVTIKNPVKKRFKINNISSIDIEAYTECGRAGVTLYEVPLYSVYNVIQSLRGIAADSYKKEMI